MVCCNNRLAKACLLGAVIGLAVLISLAAPAVGFAADADAGFVLVPEMEVPAGLFVQPKRERSDLQDNPQALRGIDRLRARVVDLWPRLRQVDWPALSRYQLVATRGWRLPAQPGELVGQVMAHDALANRWTIELRGPRLPARFDIVHRYLHVYASYDPATEELDQLTVTIRGWVLE